MNTKIDEEYRIALSEVDDILYFSDSSVVSQMPKSFMKFIKENKDKNYISNINPYLPLEEQNISEKARAIVALIYGSYIATPEEKEEFKKRMRDEFENSEKEKREKYNPDNFFENKNNESNFEKIEEKSLVLKNENLLEKLIKFMKRILKIK